MLQGSLLLLSLLSLIVSVSGEPPHRGQYAVEMRDYKVRTLQGLLKEVVVAYPVGAPENQTFPFISFAHGFMTGGPQTQLLHSGIMKGMASHGNIVGATKSCMAGCPDDGWDTYWDEQLKVILWTQSEDMLADAIIGKVNHRVGYGIAGHSMGGQATARSATRALDYNVKAAILLHPYADAFEDISKDLQVPTAGFTGSLDGCCGEDSTRQYLDKALVPNTLANLKGALHTEPNVPNSRWEAYMAAWFKIWIEGDKGDYYRLIYDKNHPDSLCTFYDMVTCEHRNM